MELSRNEVSDPAESIEVSQNENEALDAYSRTVSHAAAATSAGVVRVDVFASSTDKRVGTGSGFFFTPDGYIITNSHVVHGGNRFVGQTIEGESFAAFTVGDAPHLDIALLAGDAPQVVTLRLCDS